MLKDLWKTWCELTTNIVDVFTQKETKMTVLRNTTNKTYEKPLTFNTMHDYSTVMPDPVTKLVEMCCGCGNPELFYVAILQILQRFEDGPEWNRELGRMNDDPEKLNFSYEEFEENPFLFATIQLLDNGGYIEHGTTIRCSWLTDEGKLVRQFLEQEGTDFLDKDSWEETRDWVDSTGCGYNSGGRRAE